MSSSEHVCVICGHQALHMCQRCRESYCSQQCQILDWPKHKVICIPMPTLVPRNPKMFTKMERSVSNTSLNSSMRRPHNDSFRGRDQIVAKNPINLTYNDETIVAPQTPDNKKAVIEESAINEMVNLCLKSKTQEVVGWRSINKPPEGYFEVTVQHVEGNILYVMEPNFEQQAVKLLKSINRQINSQSPSLNPELIKEGLMFAAPYECVYYRAEVMKLNSSNQTAKLRLIDYGIQFECKVSEIKAPIPIMKNLNCYCLTIRLKDASKINLEDVMEIRVLGDADSSGIFDVEVKEQLKVKKIIVPSSPLQMILEKGSMDCFLSYIFPNKKEALATFSDNKVLETLKEMNKILDTSGEFLAEVTVGQYIAFKTKLYGWQRGMIKAIYLESNFAVYAIDYGFLEIVSQKECFKNIPEKFISMPIQTVHIEFSTKVLADKDAELELKLAVNSGASISSEKSTEGVLKTVKDVDFDKVTIKAWFGDFKEFHATFNPNDSVKIAKVITFSEVYLTLASEPIPTEIFKEFAKVSKPIEHPTLEIVLFLANDEYVRGKILKTIDSMTFQCFNVDNGDEHLVDIKNIRFANDFIKTVPITTKRFNLAYLMAMKEGNHENNRAFTVLERHMNENYVFSMNYNTDAEGEDAGIVLLFKDKNCLNKQLLPLVFEKVDIDGSNSTAKIPETKRIDIPQDVMKEEKMLDLADIELIPLTTGDNISVIVIDSSTLNTGYFSAFDPKLSSDHMKNYAAKYDQMIVDYAARTDIGSEYCPKPNEICIAVFDDDGLWYRCYCVERYEGDKFLLIFLDYGNFIKTHKSKIRKISKELMFPSNANTCIIQGFERTPESIKKLEDKIIAGQMITLKNITYTDKEYIVTLQ